MKNRATGKRDGRTKQGGSCHAAVGANCSNVPRIDRQIYNNNGFDYVLQHVYRVLSAGEVSVQRGPINAPTTQVGQQHGARISLGRGATALAKGNE